jgi:hypothetical protein
MHSSLLDLTAQVYKEIQKHKIKIKQENLHELLHELFYGSYELEEGRSNIIHIVYVNNFQDLKKLDKNWLSYQFNHPINFNSSGMAKLAPITNSRSFLLVITQEGSQDNLAISGLATEIDLENNYVRSSEEAYNILRISAFSPGELHIHINFKGLFRYFRGKIESSTPNLFDQSDLLDIGLDFENLKSITQLVNRFILSDEDFHHKRRIDAQEPPIIGFYEHYKNTCYRIIGAALYELAIRIAETRHGGLFLIASDDNDIQELLKSKSQYFFTPFIDLSQTISNLINNLFFLDPFSEYFSNITLTSKQDITIQSQRNLSATIFNISRLSTVDKAILLSPKLEVLGFGFDVLPSSNIPKIKRAEYKSFSKWSEFDLSPRGTRHQAAASFVAQKMQRIAVISSEDGPTAFFISIENNLVYWPVNFLHNFPKGKSI